MLRKNYYRMFNNLLSLFTYYLFGINKTVSFGSAKEPNLSLENNLVYFPRDGIGSGSPSDDDLWDRDIEAKRGRY